MIKDLSVAATLDSKTMATVHGGLGVGKYSAASPFAFPMYEFSKNDFNFDASQSLGQSQNTQVNNGNNAAFVSGITSTVAPHQTGSNNINFG